MLKNEGYIFYGILVVTGSNSCCCTKYAELFLLAIYHIHIFGRKNVHKFELTQLTNKVLGKDLNQ